MGQYDEYNSVQSCIVVIFLELFCLIYDKYLACDLVLIGSYQLGPSQSLDITF